MHLGLHHHSRRHRLHLPTRHSKRVVRMTDALAYTASFLSLFFTTDQLRIIWVNHNAAGVSLLLWIFLTISAAVWLFYGYIHRDRVLMITNSLWVLCNSFIVIGILLYQ